MGIFNPQTKIALTGGAGYIGSFTTKYLQSLGFNNLVILDNFSTGFKETAYTRYHEVDLMDKDKLDQIFAEEKFEAVIHFAAKIVVPHSMEKPYEYFSHNFNTSLNLLEVMKNHQVKNIVFSSTCAVYGNPEKVPLTEEEPVKCESVYAETKAQIERVIQWYSKIYGMNYALLRYFNACGASADGLQGEHHQPETHLVPLAITHLLHNEPIVIYGNDYETPDKTCIRDYIHVDDLASAHHLALKHIIEHDTSDLFNLGVGKGYSNLEIANTIIEEGKNYGLNGTVEYKPRRAGDPPVLFADNTKAKNILGWNPVHTDIAALVKEAFQWHKNLAEK